MSAYIIPLFFIVIICSGIGSRVPVYDTFVIGAKNALKTMVGIIPPLVGLLAAIEMFRASGALNLLCTGLSPIINLVGVPGDILPLALMRPISGSASLAIMTDALSRFGPDSMNGRMASVIMGATETTFYTMAIYFGAVKATQTRHTLSCALMADCAGIIAGCLACRIMFS